MHKDPLSHRMYRAIRPRLSDLGALRLARRVLPQKLRTRFAILLGLRGFDPGSAPGTIIPEWVEKTWVEKRKSGTRSRITLFDGINYIGDLRADIGISEHSRLMVNTMLEAGIPLAYTEIAYRFESRTVPLPKELKEGSPYSISVVDQNFSHFYDAILEIPPKALEGKYIITIWAWELNKFEGPWLNNFKFVDEVWTGSRYTQDVIAHVSPVPVVRIPFAVEVNASLDVTPARFSLPENRFIFLYSFSSTSTAARKNPFGYVEAFRQAFGKPGKTGPLLVLKAHHLDNPDAVLLAPALRKAVASVGGILIEDNLDRQSMYDLLAVADCFVSLHRAEGFGLGIAESMALGKPVIATAYSGNMDYMTPANSYGVSYSIKQIQEEDHAYQPRLKAIYGTGYEWADPDIDHAAKLMQQVYENQDEARQVGQRAAEYMALHYSRAAIGQRIRERFRALIESGQSARKEPS